MKMKYTQVGFLYKLDIDHNIWDGAILVIQEKNTNEHIMNIVDIRTDVFLKGHQSIDNNSYIDQKGDFKFIGKLKDFPEYTL